MFDLLSSWFSHSDTPPSPTSLDTTFIVIAIIVTILLAITYLYRRKAIKLKALHSELVAFHKASDNYAQPKESNHYYQQC